MRPVAADRRTFDPRVLHDHLMRIERERAERAAIETEGEDCEFFENARENERWEARFESMKDLLTQNGSERPEPKSLDADRARQPTTDFRNARPPSSYSPPFATITRASSSAPLNWVSSLDRGKWPRFHPSRR